MGQNVGEEKKARNRRMIQACGRGRRRKRKLKRIRRRVVDG